MKRFLGYDRLQVGGCSHLAEAIIHNHKAMKKLFALFVLVVVSTAVHAQKYHYDVNGDGMVNVSDVTTFVNNILGVPNGGEEEKNYVYDVNGDGMANVTDVTCLVNKILGILNPGEDTKPCLTCPDDHHPHMIDLGLPSGTMWACCNVDTEAPENQSPSNYGGYYAWGETEVKKAYMGETYQYYKNGKYIDIGTDIAGTEYDVAHVKWGGWWQMPTHEEVKELCKYSTSEWTTLNGVSGRKFTGINGGSIFLPAAGYRLMSGLYDLGSEGHYWSSLHYESYPSREAYELAFNPEKMYLDYGFIRCSGFTVRPVFRSLTLALSAPPLKLKIGDEETVSVTSGNGSYDVQSSDTNVATAVMEGSSVVVTAVGAGTATITVTDRRSGETAAIEVTVDDNQPQSCLICPDDHHPHMVDLGLPSGTMWACCNVDTDRPENQKPENYGGYYAWGETETKTKTKSNYSASTYQYYKNGSYQSIGSDIAGTEYDVAHVKWGGSWVMASHSQQQELFDNCTSTWTTQNGVSGRLFTGTNGGSIFLPAAGYRDDSDLYYAGSSGYYWSSTQYPSYANYACSLYFYSGYTDWSSYGRHYGFTVRPVVRNDIPVVVNDESLQVSSNELSLIAGERGAVGINTGSGYYSVQSSDENVATATVSGGTVTVTATGLGKTVITVTDTWTGQKATIEVVVVDKLKLSTSSLRLFSGAVGTVDITSGSGSYTVESSSPGVATATLEGTKVRVSAISYGTAVVTVTDTETGRTATIEVDVVGNLKLSISTDSLRLFPGDVGTVDITSGSGLYSVRSVENDVATVTLEGSKVTVKTKNLGHTAIRVTDLLSGLIATIKVTVSLCPDDHHHPHMIDLGLPSGTKWACCNVDTDRPEKQSPTNYGGYYAWGETETKSYYEESTYQHYKNGSYQSIGSDIAGTEYDVAHVKWGGSWVMASHSQQQELFDNCTSTWTTLNGVGGRLFTGTNGGSIFLPAAGYRYDSGLFDAGSYGGYWSSSQNPSSTYYAYCLFFYSGSTRWYHYDYRNYGQSVRPVVRN